MRGKSLRRTTLLVIFTVATLMGLAFARFVELSFSVVVWVVLLLPTALLWRWKLSLLSIIIFGVLLGSWRGMVCMKRLLPYRTYAGQPVTIVAVATGDSVYSDKGQIEFDVDTIELVEPASANLPGTIGVKGYGLPMVYRGDRVRVHAKLYSARGSRQAWLSFAQIELEYRGASLLNTWRQRFSAGLLSAVPEPLGSLGLGILIGQRTTLPDSLINDMAVVGLTHIVAVSGYNLTIIVTVVRKLLRDRSKYQATVLITLLLLLFVGVTGMSASIVRASMVSGLSLLAWYFGRTFKPLVLLLLVAGLTAFWYPLYLWSDIGWYLSFLAFAGVLLLVPLFEVRFLHKKTGVLLGLLLETIAAQTMTLPLTLFIFGRFSAISVVANLLVVPLVPFAMLASVVAGIIGVWFGSVASWLALPATWTMTYMVDIIAMLARLPGAYMDVSITAQQLVIGYAGLALLMVTWWRKAPKSGKI